MDKIEEFYKKDCIQVMQEIPDGSIDLIVTDPPYLMNYKTNARKDKEHRFCRPIENDINSEELLSNYIQECYRIMKDNTAMYMFCNSVKIEWFKIELEKYFNIKNIIVWDKGGLSMGDLEASFGRQYEFIILVNKGRRKFNGKRIGDIWSFKKVSGKNQLHQNEKPMDLIEQCIEKHSDEGDIVFDGFAGSATTLKASKKLNRQYIGCEIDEYYYEIGKQRLENAN